MEQLKSTLQFTRAGKDALHAEKATARAAAGTGQLERKLLTRLPLQTPVRADVGRKRRIPRNRLINKLNHLNFVGGTLQANFRHPLYGEISSLPVKPLPCLGNQLECRWAAGIDTRIFQTHHFENLILAKNRQLIKITPEIVQIDHGGLRVNLPDTAEEICDRSVQRHGCVDIRAQLIQQRTVYSGTLVDYNARAFKVSLSIQPPQSFARIDPRKPATIILTSRQRTLYSGECRVVRSTRGLQRRHYVLSPRSEEIQRYRKTQYRSPRLQLTPAPDLVFVHPVTGGRIDLKICDLSGSGFSVEEDRANALLLPGLILPEAELHFANSLKIRCSVQVVFRRDAQSRSGSSGNVRCGLTLLDISPRDHVTLLGLLHQVRDEKAYICNAVDLDELWDFFFETGFIYPGKYAFIEQNKQQIQDTYRRLYNRSPNIARHFVYQDKGVILGHMAMVRFYEDAWLIHHHAARRNAVKKAGLVVLDQIGRFSYDAYRLSSMHMNYLLCYYRPDNKFPSRVFGGLAAHINDLKGCSLDPFAFLHFDPPEGPPQKLPRGFDLLPSTPADLDALNDFYSRDSGGLALRALDLETGAWRSTALSEEYRRQGFVREKHHFSLHCRGRLAAFFTITLSDIGLNLSDLTNCLKVIVMDRQAVTADRLHEALALLKNKFRHPAMPVLLYPVSHADRLSIPYCKQYILWTLRTHGQSDRYFQYLNRLLRLA